MLVYCVLQPITIVEDKSGSNLNVVMRLVEFGRLSKEICVLDSPELQVYFGKSNTEYEYTVVLQQNGFV